MGAFRRRICKLDADVGCFACDLATHDRAWYVKASPDRPQASGDRETLECSRLTERESHGPGLLARTGTRFDLACPLSRPLPDVQLIHYELARGYSIKAANAGRQRLVRARPKLKRYLDEQLRTAFRP